MANKRIKDLATTATTTASDDFMAVDGVTNGTRKLSAATPAFLTSVTTPSLTSPASIDLTLTSGLVGTNKVNFPDTLTASSSTAGAVTIGDGNAATNVAIGGGNINAGGVLTIGGSVDNRTVANWYRDGTYEFGVQKATGRGVDYFFTGASNFNVVQRATYGTVGGTVLFSVASTGTVSIASTTASSSAITGALQVAGGIGVAGASYFGGGINLTTAASGTSQLTIANTNGTGKAHVGSFASSTYLSTNYFYLSGHTTDDATLGSASIVLGVDRTIKFFSAAASATPANSLILTLDGATNAATFAGAVTAGGKITSAVSLPAGNNPLYDTTGLTTGRGAFAITSTGAGLAFGVESSTPGTSLTGSAAYSSYFGTSNATAAYLITNSVIRLTIDGSTGAATFAGTVIAPAATASLAPLRIPHGTAPTSPTNGDMWTTTAGLFIRINGATVGPLS